MPNSVNALMASALLAIAGSASAESLYSIESPELVGTTLYAQSLSETGLVTVKPRVSAESIGDTEVLNQCLWSIQIVLGDGDVGYAPGKMVCIGPQQEVLESTPVGSIEPVGQCVTANCERVNIEANTYVVMTLSEPLAFDIQARNER